MKVIAISPPSFPPLSMVREQAPDVDLIVGETAGELRPAIGEVEVIVVRPRLGEVLRELWPEAKRLRWIHTLSAGVDNLLFDELVASDVVLTNGRGVFAPALAEFAAFAMLWFAKDGARLLRNRAEKRWEPFQNERVEGKTVGIVGYGGNGRAVAHLAQAFGMKIVATRANAAAGGPIVALDELLRVADYVVITAPLTEATHHMIGAREIALMKREAVLINVGRGPVVDEAALIAALESGAIRGAALDVFEVEPLPPESPLWTLDNVFISPHSADRASDSHHRAMALFLDNLARFRRGEPLLNVVDKRARY